MGNGSPGTGLRRFRLRACGLAVALGLTLDITGALHVYGLSALMGQRLAAGAALLLALIAMGWVLVAAPLLNPQNSELKTQNHGLSEVEGSKLAPALMLLAWLATARDFALFLAPGLTPFWALFFGLGGVALALALVWSPPAGWLVAGAALAGSVVRVASFGFVPIEPARGDMLPLALGALGNLLAGQSPYTIYRMPWELPLTYLPVTWLAYLPPYLLGLDIRLTNLLAELSIGAALAWLAPRGESLLLWAWVFLLPTSLHWTLATTAPVGWALLALALVLLAAGRLWESALALGLCAAASPLATVVAPFALARWLRARGARAAALYATAAIAVAAVFIIPFLLWSPQQFVLGAWRWFNDNDLFPRLRWEMDNTWARMVGFSGIFWRRGLEDILKPIQALAIAGLAGLYWRWGANAAQLAPLVVAAYLLFMVFNPVLWPYLYTPALIAALVAVNSR